MTQVPQTDAAPAGIATLSVEEILKLEEKIRENRAALLRKEPPPHNITPEMLAAAINGMRASRGTLDMVKSAAPKAGKKAGPEIKLIDLDEL